MSKTIAWVAKLLGVCVLTLIMYTFMFGTADFFVFDASGMGGYDGAIAQIINAVEVPMARYYNTSTYQANEYQTGILENSVRSNSLVLEYSP